MRNNVGGSFGVFREGSEEDQGKKKGYVFIVNIKQLK